MGPSEEKIRARLATVLADAFLVHLKAEIQKADELIKRPTRSGISFQKVTEDLIEDLTKEFPNLAGTARGNIIEEWVIRRDTPVAYADSTFRSYNLPFYQRILDLRDNTESTRSRLKEGINHLLSTGNFYGQTITFHIFFRAENVMREIIRERLERELSIPFLTAWEIWKEQSEFWANCGYEYYDSLLGETLGEIRKQRDAAEARNNLLLKEMRVASEIQTAILPNSVPSIKGLELAVIYRPADSVGGDFYDFSPISEQELGIIVADVTGHGIPSALIASMIKISFRHQRHLARDPRALLMAMSDEIALPRDRYMPWAISI